MTANRSQYMILDADDSDMERRGRRNRAYSRGPALPLIRNQYSPDHTTLKEIAQEQHPDDSPRETQQRVQLMQRHLEEDRYRVTHRSERHEVTFGAVETSTPPVVAPPTPQPAAVIDTRPAWAIKLEQDFAAIQQQEEQQQAAQLAQQQTVTVEEVEDDEPLSYAEGTPQPLAEVPALPGHYQIEFPGEQIEGETNSDVSEIEELKPLPIPPRDTRPSGFTIPSPPRRFTPLSPRQFTSPPPPHVQPFPESSFCSWIADRTKRKELFDKLEANAPPIASQLDIYAKMKLLQL